MRRTALALMVSAAVVGCGGGGPPDDLTNLAQPAGKVLLANGNPARGALVEFTPTAPDGHAAYGVAKSDGTFKILTRGGQDGIVPGAYKVKVVPSYREETPAADAEFAKKSIPGNVEQDMTIAAGQSEVVIKINSSRAP